jgi:PAS domain S-box-containing protein
MTDPGRVNILLVDDQLGKLLSYEVILQDIGENLLKARSGTEALGLLLKHEVAVVLVDVCMPELDGFELAAMIREHPRCQKTAIIFISAIHLTDVDRLKGYEMGAVDYVPVPVVPEVLRAKVKIFAELYRKTRELQQLNSELERRVAERTAELESYAGRLLQSERRRSLALAAGKMGSWDWDLTRGDCMWDEGQCRIFGVDPRTFRVTPERVRALLDPEDWDRLNGIWAEAAAGTRTYETEFRVRRPNGELRWCIGTAAASVDTSNRIVRLSGVTIDITDRRQAEERQVFLAREVDHRARNVLAVMQSILRLTRAGTVEGYVSAVEGRINALSRAHMLLSECRWEGADLRRLVDEELEPYRTGEAERILTVGSEVLLESRCAQTIALALHELATNAAKHGALALPSGRIQLSWQIESGNLVMEWWESDGPLVSTPSLQGYGTRVIRVSVEHLGGQSTFDWHPEGLHCTLSFPYDDRNIASRSPKPNGKSQKNPRPRPQIVDGNTVLLAEDESVVALMMTEALIELGFCVIGPYSALAEAAGALSKTPVSAAILDINLGGELVYPVADILMSKGVPLIFVTGYGAESIDPKYEHVPLLQKPIDRAELRELFILGSTATAPLGTQDDARDIRPKVRQSSIIREKTASTRGSF